MTMIIRTLNVTSRVVVDMRTEALYNDAIDVTDNTMGATHVIRLVGTNNSGAILQFARPPRLRTLAGSPQPYLEDTYVEIRLFFDCDMASNEIWTRYPDSNENQSLGSVPNKHVILGLTWWTDAPTILSQRP